MITDEEYARWVFLLGEHYKDIIFTGISYYDISSGALLYDSICEYNPRIIIITI